MNKGCIIGLVIAFVVFAVVSYFVVSVPPAPTPLEQEEKIHPKLLGRSYKYPIKIVEKDKEKVDGIIKEYIKDNYPDYRIKGASTSIDLRENSRQETRTLEKISKDERGQRKKMEIYFEVVGR